ncbi:MAG: hypothetical protein OHK0022_22460 [Roseiflexaceae bacterium]
MSNNSHPPTPTGPERRLQEIAAQLIARHDWKLMAAVDLAEQTKAILLVAEQEGWKLDLERAMLRAYGETMYIACCGVEGQERRSRAYIELGVYLRRVAQRAFPDQTDMVEDFVQTALMHICRRLDKVHTPQGFLVWAFLYVLDAAKQWRRQNGNNTSLDQLLEAGDTSLMQLTPNLAGDPLEQLLARDGHNELWQTIERLNHRHRRARNQLAAVLLKFRDGLDDTEIAQRLGVSVPQVHVLRSRGLKLLRKYFDQDDGTA